MTAANVSPADRRAEAVGRTIEQVRALVSGRQYIGIATAQGICELMGQLAADAALWSSEDFPVPEDKLWQAYQLHEDADGSYAIYAVAMKPGHQQPPHNHTTWAVIAGVRGRERNELYVREDESDGSRARIRHLMDITVGEGKVIAMGADDIHSIEVLEPEKWPSRSLAARSALSSEGEVASWKRHGDEAALHLHLYGKGLSHLNDRLIFDLESGVGRPFPVIQGIK